MALTLIKYQIKYPLHLVKNQLLCQNELCSEREKKNYCKLSTKLLKFIVYVDFNYLNPPIYVWEGYS